MVRCPESSESRLEDSQCTHCGLTGSSRFPSRVFWLSLTATLLVVIVALVVTVKFALESDTQSSLQDVRTTVVDHPVALINQSTLVDKHNSIVTYSVTTEANHTSTVLFDMNNGLICYKPDNKDTCFLRQMESTDYENMHTVLNESKQQVSQVWLVGNETQRQTEFLGILANRSVAASVLQKPLQELCQKGPVYWTRRADGPKERLIYFCIDICFPSNICVSVCFYYLPE